MRSTVPLLILCKCVLIFWQVSFSFASDCPTNGGPQEQPIPGNAVELVLAKLDHLQIKQLEMELELKERDEELAEKLLNLETLFQEESRKILAQNAACANHKQMRQEISQLSAGQRSSTIGQLLSTSLYLQGSVKKVEPLKSCIEAPANKSGVYTIQVGDKEELLKVFCEQNSFGGGWLVFQFRFDGSLIFYRNWTEYRNGFGDVNKEFWIGLEWLHQLTSSRRYELMVELKDFEGTYKYAHYSEFEIGSESEQYPLKNLGAYDGTAGDSLTYQVGMKFTTKDRDNDKNSGNCALKSEAAWWYKDCAYANLNGRYLNKEDTRSMYWYHYKNLYNGWAYSRMMIRKINTGV